MFKVANSLVLLCIFGGCVFGFLACFEPMADPGHILKMTYLLTGAAAAFALAYLWFVRKKPN